MEFEHEHPIRYVVGNFARPYVPLYLGGLLLLAVSLVPQRVPALLVGVAVDAIVLETVTYSLPAVPAEWIPAGQLDQLWFTVALLGAAVVVEAATGWLGRLLYGYASLRTLHDVRVAAFERVVARDVAFFDAADRGQLLSALNDDVNNVERLAEGVRDGLVYGGQVVAGFAFMLLVHWELALVVLAIPVALSLSSWVYARLLRRRYEAVRESVGGLNTRLQEAVEGISTVKAFTAEPQERARVAEASTEYRERNWSTIRLRLGYQAASFLASSVGVWGLFLLGGYWILSGPPLGFEEPLTPGSLLTFLIYTQSFLDPTKNLAVQVFDAVSNAAASTTRVAALLDTDATPAAALPAGAPAVERGRVRFENVWFGYPGAEEPTLRGVSFAVEPGRFVGVVGGSGAGKSTLLKLLLGFYEPTVGRVTVDGRDLSDLDGRRLRRSVGYVRQDPLLFDDSVRENVAYASPEAGDAAVRAAAERAGAHEFVSRLPEGYDTSVGERGSRLSGGQRQRVAIARALLDDPAILVLDEATSHVDNETQLEIQRRIREVAGDRTVFAVAHRLSTVRHADEILVLDDGRLVERGTHEALLEANGRYADLWRVQVGSLGDAERRDARGAHDD